MSKMNFKGPRLDQAQHMKPFSNAQGRPSKQILKAAEPSKSPLVTCCHITAGAQTKLEVLHPTSAPFTSLSNILSSLFKHELFIKTPFFLS